MKDVLGRVGMDGRLLQIRRWILTTPILLLAGMGLVGTILIGIPVSDAIYGIFRTSMWVLMWTAVGCLFWPAIAAVFTTLNASLRIPAVIATAIITVLPAGMFYLFYQSASDFLGAATLLYLFYLFNSGCLLCATVPLAWRLYAEKNEPA